MKRSEILFRILIALFVVMAVTVFVLPQEVLDGNELVFLWVIMPLVGWMWIQMLADTRNNK